MSTVLLTPTHIASDHCVIHSHYPISCHVDPSHRKIFVSPDRRFIFATEGDYYPEAIDTPDTFDRLRDLLILFYAHCESIGTTKFSCSDNVYSDLFTLKFDKKAKHLLVTKDHRLIAYYSGKDEAVKLVACGDAVGLGSGGPCAVGLYRSGMDVSEIWPHVHRIDTQSSEQHTVIDLALLRDWSLS